MKWKYLSIVMLLILSIMTGCSALSNESDEEEKPKEKVEQTRSDSTSSDFEEMTAEEKQQAVLDYVHNEVNSMAQIEMEALETLYSVQGENYTDPQTLYDVLVNEVIPLYERALTEARNLNPTIKDMETPTQTIVEAMEHCYEAILMLKSAIEKNDSTLKQQSDEEFNEYIQLVEQYRTLMKEVGLKYDVEFESQQMNE